MPSVASGQYPLRGPVARPSPAQITVFGARRPRTTPPAPREGPGSARDGRSREAVAALLRGRGSGVGFACTGHLGPHRRRGRCVAGGIRLLRAIRTGGTAGPASDIAGMTWLQARL